MRIAVVGTGISGLVAAYQLYRHHDVVVYEAADYVGGHTHTVEVEVCESRYRIDTGFIVFNDRTYPNFVRLLERLGVASQPSDMSFSVQCEATELEYCGSSLDTLFAQRANLFHLSFYSMLADIVRFNRASKRLLRGRDDTTTLGDFVRQRGYSESFRRHYLAPMLAAIWSADPMYVEDFPACHFLDFFENHGLLNLVHRPQWRVVQGGSSRYVEKLIEGFQDRIRLRTPVLGIRRFEQRVDVTTPEGTEPFDHLILAVHSNQALGMLADPTDTEREVLGAIRYQPNEVTLHTDTSLLPKNRRAWAGWNYHIPATPGRLATVTYNMNRLQSIDAPGTFCVSLNSGDRIARSRVLGRFTYDHPVYSARAVAAQRRHGEISGVGRTHYCGAYWGYGFHEDGVKSALTGCAQFGAGTL